MVRTRSQSQQEQPTTSKMGVKNKLGLYTHYKNLYQRVSLPDNYTDADFFSSTLKVNPIPRLWTLRDSFLHASRATLQLCVNVLFFTIYYHMSRETLSPAPVLVSTVITTMVGYCYYILSPVRHHIESFQMLRDQFPKEHVQLSIIYVIFSYQLAPILRKLTETVSTDTIHATAICMLCVHLATCEYGVSAFLVSKTTSVNAAVIGSICLASRMTADLQSLTLLTFAVQSFVLFPVFSKLLYDSGIIIVIFVLVGCLASLSISSNVLLVFVVVSFCVSIFFPYLFVLSTKAKTNFYGPWDEATVTFSSN